MTADKGGRSKSPIHVHVEDSSPVHVHVKKPKKPIGRQSYEVGSKIPCSMLETSNFLQIPLRKKSTIHHVTTILATSKNVRFPGHSHLFTTSIDDPSIAGAQAIIKVSGHQYLWLAGGYDLEIGHF